ncbi:rho guanine nucleotide exchange factor 39 [Puntigrus tetrazona]|uniref:rho guanine nucleotide exchange factor 39 n=1 Tax=Puntigrus tetrazona TaxID=1606681 RepID=UPI001C896C57|nr:rho guanine nucleotide exchange factor 39 [Puntigrus tetrazona]XP_043092295.1 rho guanine nucleotide exchange factor 39 [Puntigrus tetrazona]XP_043092297.1 rho guanine nucleotide exchange factor 39 [Puntigrus tetrazona]XP_043092298.1 rho guanine nucleotide exchange factor 39 [Puntigrus tetrazona]XP_043092299.1 rho guanine nucleotide exchange factor 39 [Puntigrus tetrazona]XP_043092300.1 rho guanine nucleotide exchange factor 39 [Puntigrus tetrazona]XP_043092301.1 rho guanine nucleotide exc
MSFAPSPFTPMGVRSIQDQRERWERKRSRTARELVQSEQRYCEQLDLVITYFVEILKAKGTLRQDIRESIFSSIKSIHLINQTLLSHLELERFGIGFEEFCTHLQLYNTYVDNIQTAKKVLTAQVKKSKAFRRFKKLQESRPEFRQQKLEDLLALPLQRIQQYKHFLRDLTENTGPDNPEFQQLSKAVKAISEVAQRIQDNARSYENHLQLRRVQKQLKGRKTRILTPGRWYIREGWLKTVPPKGTEAKPKMFYLFSDILLQAKPCSPIHPTNGDKFVCQRIYPLKECTVDKVFGHTKSQGGLISLTFARAKLLLMSDDQRDINDWYRSLCLAIGQLKSKNTVVHRRDELRRKPIRSDPDSQNTPELQQTRGIKRAMILDEAVVEHREGHSSSSIPSTEESGYSATKRLKPSEAPAARPQESSGSSCVIL